MHKLADMYLQSFQEMVVSIPELKKNPFDQKVAASAEANEYYQSLTETVAAVLKRHESVVMDITVVSWTAYG